MWIPPESDDVIYEQPLIALSSGKALHNTSNCSKSESEEYDPKQWLLVRHKPESNLPHAL